MVGVRRLEVITGVGGRRAWSHEDKGRIVAESFAAGANVSAVARRYGLRPQQVYAWRRLARGGALALPAAEALGFVPVVAAESEPAPSVTSASMPTADGRNGLGYGRNTASASSRSTIRASR